MALSSLITFIAVLVILGLVLYLIETLLPVAEPFKTAIRVVMVLFVVLYLLSMFGLYRIGS